MRNLTRSGTTSVASRALSRWLCVFLFALLAAIPAGGSAAQKYQKHNLNITIPGINDHASNTWVGAAGVMSPTRERYVIVPGKRQRQQGLFGRLLYGQSFDYRVASVPRENVIRIDDPRSPEGVRQLARIAGKENVTVIVDMDIGRVVGSGAWGSQTDWAGEVAATLAAKHLDKYPDSRTVLVGHSAGTQAMVTAHKLEKIAKRVLFKKSIAASPMNPLALSKKTLMVISDSDLAAVPEGKLSPSSIVTATKGRRAENLAKKGYQVLRVVTETRNFWIPKPLEAHRATADFYYPDQKVLVYSPDSAKPVEMPSTSLTNVINEVYKAARSPTIVGQRAKLDPLKLKDVAKTLRRNEPSPGLGGISLNATATIPLDPRNLRGAGYNTGQNRLYLRLRGGETVLFPRMDPEVLRLAYESAYRAGKKPELSIGTSEFITPQGQRTVTLHPPGKQPVYYLPPGKTADTLLGLVMYRADEALSKIAFGSTSDVGPLAEQVPGFRSLPELFPEKYTEHPASDRYVGTDTRVFIHPVRVEFSLADGSGAFESGEIAFAARFGRTGPAEVQFAAFFASRFAEIVNTELGAPIGALIPFARAAAVFRWLKENGIAFDAGALSRTPISKVFTPRYVSSIIFPRLEEIAPRLPTMFFGPFGPVRVIRADGRETVISYKYGLPLTVKRYDGAVLEISRDGLGTPLALQLNGKHQAAFYVDTELGPVFAENVRLHRDGRGLAIELRPDTVRYPDNQPEATVSLIIGRFVFSEEGK